jgi:hypothetical protein
MGGGTAVTFFLPFPLFLPHPAVPGYFAIFSSSISKTSKPYGARSPL